MLRSAISVYLLVLLGAACPTPRAQQQSSPPASAQRSVPKPAEAPADDKTPPAGPATDAEQTPKKSSVEENPFPEEQSKSAAKQVEDGQAPPLPADLADESPTGKASGPPDASGTQTSEEGISSSRTRLEGLDQTDPDAKRKALPKVSDPVHNPKMSAEDVAIGKMYFQSENYRGAYIRYKEALSLDPENPDAAFGVAETARKLNQTKEAIENYRLCLDLDPDGPRAKASRKALNALSSVSTH
jgi:tetratricopeptide (TPR) repeat protein